jgi:inorganic triphosphatase YgiF
MATTRVTVVQETERKYEVPDTVELPDPTAALGLSGGVEEQVLTAIYFDTPGLRLLRAGITLRRRGGRFRRGMASEAAGRRRQP